MVQGKVALVTGGGGGIGRATCQVLARDGAKVVVADLRLSAAEETVQSLPGKDHLSLLLDVTKEENINEVFNAITTKYGTPPTIVVNCAGILIFKPFLEETPDLYHRQFDINVKGTLQVTQRACKDLKAAGLKGSIVNMSSVCGTGVPAMISYGATKAAIECLSKAVGREFGGIGIRCNAVSPGPIATPLIDPVPNDYATQTINKIPMKRVGEPMEVAETIGFLASEKSSYINATTINVNGGI